MSTCFCGTKFVGCRMNRTIFWYSRMMDKDKMHVCKEVFVDLTAGGIHEFEFQ